MLHWLVKKQQNSSQTDKKSILLVNPFGSVTVLLTPTRLGIFRAFLSFKIKFSTTMTFRGGCSTILRILQIVELIANFTQSTY